MLTSLPLHWSAHYIPGNCEGFLCSFDWLIPLWIVSALLSFMFFRLRPMNSGKAIFRILSAAIFTLTFYGLYYDTMDHTTWSDHHLFIDYSLPGILLTIVFSVVWLIPANQTKTNS
ncbi:MAG: hypothetical protein ACI865_002299 [Flavobacteriaceae bacterium]|jgi:hypothetical protein